MFGGRTSCKTWQNGTTVPINKKNDGRDESKNYNWISLLTICGKVCGKVIIEKVSK